MQRGQVTPFDLNDVESGNDSVAEPETPFSFAGNGIDPSTGWGTIDGTKMSNALAKILYPKSTYNTVVKHCLGPAEVECPSCPSSSAWTARRLVSFPVRGPSISTLSSDAQISIESAIRKTANEPSMVQRIRYAHNQQLWANTSRSTAASRSLNLNYRRYLDPWFHSVRAKL